MIRTIGIFALFSLLGACTAPQPVSCDGSNLRPINIAEDAQHTEVKHK